MISPINLSTKITGIGNAQQQANLIRSNLRDEFVTVMEHNNKITVELTVGNKQEKIVAVFNDYTEIPEIYTVMPDPYVFDTRDYQQLVGCDYLISRIRSGFARLFREYFQKPEIDEYITKFFLEKKNFNWQHMESDQSLNFIYYDQECNGIYFHVQVQKQSGIYLEIKRDNNPIFSSDLGWPPGIQFEKDFQYILQAVKDSTAIVYDILEMFTKSHTKVEDDGYEPWFLSANRQYFFNVSLTGYSTLTIRKVDLGEKYTDQMCFNINESQVVNAVRSYVN